MKTIGLMAAVSIAISTLAVPATADPWKDESGHGRWGGYEHKKDHWKPKRHHYREHRRERSGFGIYFESRPAYRYRPAPEYRSAGNAHVEWCYSRYRSYDVRTDTFQPYDGPRRYCISPYR